MPSIDILASSGTQINIFGIPCYEMLGSGRETITWTGNDNKAIREIWCPWASHYVFIEQARGGWQVSPTTGYLVYQAGLPYPAFPYLVMNKIDVEGVPGPNGCTIDQFGSIAYQYAKMTITFGNIDYPPGTAGLLEVDLAAQVTSVNSTGNTLQFADGTSPQVDGYKSRGVGTLRYTSHNIGTIPWQTITSLLMPEPMINNVQFNPPPNIRAIQNCTFAPGQLLYAGAKTTVRWAPSGAINYDVSHTLAIDLSGHNNLLQTNGTNAGKFFPVFWDSSHTVNFYNNNLGDLAIIFNPTAP